MTKRTITEIKKIEQEIFLALQILRNEIETLTIIKNHMEVSESAANEANLIIQEELDESVTSIEELIHLHKNLEEQIDVLEVLVQDITTVNA